MHVIATENLNATSKITIFTLLFTALNLCEEKQSSSNLRVASACLGVASSELWTARCELRAGMFFFSFHLLILSKTQIKEY